MLNVRKEDLERSAGGAAGFQKPDHLDAERCGVAGRKHSDRRIAAWEVIPRLKDANAQGIVEYPLNKVVM